MALLKHQSPVRSRFAATARAAGVRHESVKRLQQCGLARAVWRRSGPTKFSLGRSQDRRCAALRFHRSARFAARKLTIAFGLLIVPPPKAVPLWRDVCQADSRVHESDDSRERSTMPSASARGRSPLAGLQRNAGGDDRESRRRCCPAHDHHRAPLRTRHVPNAVSSYRLRPAHRSCTSMSSAQISGRAPS